MNNDIRYALWLSAIVDEDRYGAAAKADMDAAVRALSAKDSIEFFKHIDTHKENRHDE